MRIAKVCLRVFQTGWKLSCPDRTVQRDCNAKNIYEGSYVGATNEKPLLVIEDTRKLRLRIAVPEAFTGVDLKDNKVKFTTKAYPNKPFTAMLVRKAGSIDVNTRTEIWEFEVDNPDNSVKAGSFATVNLTVSRKDPTFFVPFSAVVTTLEKKFVIKISNDSTRWVDVSPGINLSDKTEIFGLLNEGDTLVIKANEEIKPNEKVYVKF
ncbi:MAG: efflux RND transporter periplasmic adaptor subunit [Cyclobacteriaceae bacterium]|nr:MAG: efflux RND transporter periplasmic adaptor subunit [Cyclobacteriaceae bacterium]